MSSLRPAATSLLVVAGLVLGPAIALAGCPDRPIAACRAAGQATLTIDDAADVTRRRVKLVYRRGPATTQAAFGSPPTSTTTSLCIWDDAGSLLTLDVPPATQCAGEPCWSSLRDGFLYDDPSSSASGIRSMLLKGSSRPMTQIVFDGRGAALPDLPRSPTGSITAQIVRDDGAICFEALFDAASVSRTGAARTSARLGARSGIPPLPSSGCGQAAPPYPLGSSTIDALVHDALTRTFRVYLPASYDGSTPIPVVLNFHGGFGSGAQQEASSRITELAGSAGFIAVSPDGVPDPTYGIRTWNGGGCCGYAMNSNVDDVGFVRALIDHLEATLCIDRRRVYAQGMSNGAILSHRLGCELADRIRAIGPVAGTNMTAPCEPTRPVPVREIHGSADAFVPYAGGLGCGPGGIAYASVPNTLDGWRVRAACRTATGRSVARGDAVCTGFGGCAAGVDVDQCIVANGGHAWPGGTAPVVPGIGSCLFGYQSQTFSASEQLWSFFAAHPTR